MKVNGRGACADERRFAKRDRETVASRRAPPTLPLYQKRRGISSVFSRFLPIPPQKEGTRRKETADRSRKREAIDGERRLTRIDIRAIEFETSRDAAWSRDVTTNRFRFFERRLVVEVKGVNCAVPSEEEARC